MPITLAGLRAYIRSRLGDTSLDIELEDADIDTASQEALDTYNRMLPGRKERLLGVNISQKRYVISDVKNLTGISEVQFGRLNDFAPIAVENQGVPLTDVYGASSVMSDYALNLAYRKDFARVFSADPEWTKAWEYKATPAPHREYALYINIPGSDQVAIPFVVSYTALYYRTLDDDLEAGLPDIPEAHLEWLKKACLAINKKLLGRILDKFKGIPSPDGADLQVDGADLLAQGDAEWQQSLADMIAMQRQLPPIIA